MEYRVGSRFEMKGKVIEVKEEGNGCKGCCFRGDVKCYLPRQLSCSENGRSDKKSVIYVIVKKCED